MNKARKLISLVEDWGDDLRQAYEPSVIRVNGVEYTDSLERSLHRSEIIPTALASYRHVYSPDGQIWVAQKDDGKSQWKAAVFLDRSKGKVVATVVSDDFRTPEEAIEDIKEKLVLASREISYLKKYL